MNQLIVVTKPKFTENWPLKVDVFMDEKEAKRQIEKEGGEEIFRISSEDYSEFPKTQEMLKNTLREINEKRKSSKRFRQSIDYIFKELVEKSARKERSRLLSNGLLGPKTPW